MNYIAKNVKEQIVVWIKEANRYIVFQQPAFKIFEQIAKNREINDIANWFSRKHKIAVSESLQFVNEINSNLNQLEKNRQSEFPKKEKVDFSGLIRLTS
jgi:hypothetical protein